MGLCILLLLLLCLSCSLILFILAVSTGDNCTLGEVRLFNGSNDSEGRVEICLVSGWGTVSSFTWNTHEARVACYNAGFGGPGNNNNHHLLVLLTLCMCVLFQRQCF